MQTPSPDLRCEAHHFINDKSSKAEMMVRPTILSMWLQDKKWQDDEHVQHQAWFTDICLQYLIKLNTYF
jgi:hypothetical protein